MQTLHSGLTVCCSNPDSGKSDSSNFNSDNSGNFYSGSSIVIPEEENNIGTQKPNCSCRDHHSGFGFFFLTLLVL